MNSISDIDTDFGQKLKNKKYRHRFFETRTKSEIPLLIRGFRENRNLSQAKLAKLCSMKQSAISRIENTSNSSWNLTTLWRIAEALDLRLKIELVPMEEEIKKYQDRQEKFEEIATTENIEKTFSIRELSKTPEEEGEKTSDLTEIFDLEKNKSFFRMNLFTNSIGD